MNGELFEADDDTPRCEKCGAEITTGLMAAYCPEFQACDFWPRTAESQGFICSMRLDIRRRAEQGDIRSMLIEARWDIYARINQLAAAHQAKISEHAQQHRAFINRSIGQSSRHIWR